MLRKCVKIIFKVEFNVVSILVVMESAQEVSPQIFTTDMDIGFNPCCNGKCSGRIPSGVSSIRPNFVSILVVMESAQEVIVFTTITVIGIGFNPCCNGKCSGRGTVEIGTHRLAPFQSLL